ncbi:DUF1488 domain-containing protein [Enterovibrio sp. 27052020O]|uniref:DUF1488 domain-containing protein n=1 Tax=Enterovibrio sp. 27052020O TaxID=3241166 RepID=UPI00388EC388
MNQSILFSDGQRVDADKQAVRFDAQQYGALIPCFVAIADLQKRHQDTLMTKKAILTVFSQHRFDYEDLAEEAIEAEDFNERGEIWVS